MHSWYCATITTAWLLHFIPQIKPYIQRMQLPIPPLPDSDNHNPLCFCFFFFYSFIYLFYFTILYWFYHTLTWILHGCTCVPHPEPPSHHPSGSSQCTSSEHPVSCIEPGLAIHFTYDNLHVSMPFSISSHPRPLPQSPKDCSIHLCLFCCLTYKAIVTIFLNSVYMR